MNNHESRPSVRRNLNVFIPRFALKEISSFLHRRTSVVGRLLETDNMISIYYTFFLCLSQRPTILLEPTFHKAELTLEYLLYFNVLETSNALHSLNLRVLNRFKFSIRKPLVALYFEHK